MKNISIILLVLIGFFANAQDARMNLNQRQKKEIQHRKAEIQRRKAIHKQRLQQWKSEHQRRLIQALEISDKQKKQKFRQIYTEYNDNQERIKRKFKPNRNFNQMSDEQARKELKQSFQVGAELLENRKKYSDEFQKIIKPQKVLKLFHHEGKMRREMMKRRDGRR